MSNSDEYFNRTEKNPWNQLFMHTDNDGPKNEDYKISSSLKTIWSDCSDGRTNGSYSNVDDSRRQFNVAQGCAIQTQRPQTTEYVQFGNNVIAIENGSQPKPARTVGTGSNYNVTNSNSLKGRAITSRSGGYSTHFGNENQPANSSVLTGLLPHQQSQSLETFLLQVQLIVKNGFLDHKILTEPISPDTFDLVQMLIFYVMEYGRAKSHSSKDEIDNTFYKIKLIQNEITKCQLNYIQQNRVQMEIMQSFSAIDGFISKQQNFTGYPLSNQYGHGQWNGKNPWNSVPKQDAPNQRFGPRQFDQFAAQQPNANSSGNFTFLPKAKNVDKRSRFVEPNICYLRRDGYFPTN